MITPTPSDVPALDYK